MEKFNVENNVAHLTYTDDQGNIQAEVKWQLTDNITTFDYLTVKKHMIMSLEGRFEETIIIKESLPKPEVERTPYKPFEPDPKFQPTNRPYDQPKPKPYTPPPSKMDWTKMILDLVENKDPDYYTEFQNKNEFYKYMDRQYGNGGFQSAPKLNSMNNEDKKTLYMNIRRQR